MLKNLMNKYHHKYVMNKYYHIHFNLKKDIQFHVLKFFIIIRLTIYNNFHLYFLVVILLFVVFKLEN